MTDAIVVEKMAKTTIAPTREPKEG